MPRPAIGACERGNLSVVTALVAVPLCSLVGAGIDYQYMSSTRDDLQATLNSATLAVAAKDGSLDVAKAKKFFTSNSKLFGVNISAIDFQKQADGSILGTVTADTPAGLSSILGADRHAIKVSSRAKGSFPTKLTQATFQITNTQGAYDKDIYFFTKDKDGKILTQTLVLQYDYTLKNNKGSAVTTPASTSAVTVTVGPYETYGEMMVVYQDTTYTGKKVNPVSLWSDDPKASAWTKVSGACSDKGGQTQNWEDGGDTNFLDFVFTLSCTLGSSGKVNVRLVN